MPKKWILLSTTDEVIIHIVELLYVFFKVLLMFVVVKAFIQKIGDKYFQLSGIEFIQIFL